MPPEQASLLSQMSAVASGPNVSLLHELMGFLRKALGQQAAVREALYVGALQVLHADAGKQSHLGAAFCRGSLCAAAGGGAGGALRGGAAGAARRRG